MSVYAHVKQGGGCQAVVASPGIQLPVSKAAATVPCIERRAQVALPFALLGSISPCAFLLAPSLPPELLPAPHRWPASVHRSSMQLR